jgi:hypothetical protein
MKKLSFLPILLVIVALASCESPSGRAHRAQLQRVATAKLQPEKVVVISLESRVGHEDVYKVKRPNKGVVVFIKLTNESGVYAENDTIFFKF